MLKNVNFILLIFCPLIIFSQNLVKNPGFEDYHFLPGNYYRQDTFYCKNWFIPNKSSVDYYNLNCKYEKGRNPLAIFNDVPPFNGNSYIGMIPIVWDGYMEQITGTLITPMQKDSIYIVSFYLRFAGNLCKICSKKFEIKFTNDTNLYSIFIEPWYDNMFKERKIIADIRFDISELCDSVYWKHYSAKYKARGYEKFITLGLFYQNDINLNVIIDEYRTAWPKGVKYENKFLRKYSNTSILMNNQNYISDSLALKLPYYFIDDVSVELDTSKH